MVKPASLDAKVLGFGKCGSRMCYDFFATSCGYPLSYELRMPTGSLLDRIRQLTLAKFHAFLSEFFSTKSAPLNITYGFFDSDSENEIAQSIAIAEQSNERELFAFPGERHPLGSHGSGCDYGIVAEAIAATQSLPTQIQNNPATFRLWLAALAGGTGSGSVLVFLRKDRAIKRQNSTHHLVIGVLPAEDLATINGPDSREAERDHAINAGRFLVRWLAEEHQPSNRGDGLLLISNSATAFLNPNASASVFRPEALLNTFAARAFFHMAYANSADATCHPDFDPTEMTNAFSGGLLIAGMATQAVDDSEEAAQRKFARRLVAEALSNPRVKSVPGADDMVVGLSVPLRQSELDGLHRAIEHDGPIEQRPLEFERAQRVIVLCAVSSKRGAQTRKEEIERLIRLTFPNSDVKFHFMLSRTDHDFLTVLVVNPFLRQVQRLVYGYIAHAWANDGVAANVLGETLDNFLQNVRTSAGQTPQALLRAEENCSAPLLGDRTAELLAQTPPRLVTSEELMCALRRLQGMLGYTRVRAPSSRI